MKTNTDDAEASEERDAEAASERQFDFRLFLGLSLSLLFVVSVLVFVVIRQDDDGCASWEQQLGNLSSALTRHRLAQGESRLAAVDSLQKLHLRCEKVSESRDACVAAYRHLLLAEREQERAKKVLKNIEKSVNLLDDNLQEVARRRLIENESLEHIAEALVIPREQVEESLQSALATIGPERLEKLHHEFEGAVKTAANHVKSGTLQNKRCDDSYKSLLEAAQAR